MKTRPNLCETGEATEIFLTGKTGETNNKTKKLHDESSEINEPSDHVKFLIWCGEQKGSEQKLIKTSTLKLAFKTGHQMWYLL